MGRPRSSPGHAAAAALAAAGAVADVVGIGDFLARAIGVEIPTRHTVCASAVEHGGVRVAAAGILEG